jgi:hypothetical protein
MTNLETAAFIRLIAKLSSFFASKIQPFCVKNTSVKSLFYKFINNYFNKKT